MSRLNITIPVTFTNEQQADLFRTCIGYKSRIERLEAENAKLRKAAGDAWFLFVRFGAVHPYNLPEVDRVRESLQELGIEVKDD